MVQFSGFKIVFTTLKHLSSKTMEYLDGLKIMYQDIGMNLNSNDCVEDNSHLNNLKGSFTKYVTGWEINVEYNPLNSFYKQNCMRDNNWHGWIGNDDIGSIKTKLKGCGTAQLNFGNCYERGITQVTLDEKVIGTAFPHTISKIIEFYFEDGAILELQELNTGIIVFNDLTITKCKSCPQLHKDYFEQPRMFGSFMMNAYLMFSETHPDSAKVVLNSMQQIIRENNINMDLSSLSKLLILDDYKNIDLVQYGIFKSCFDYFMEPTTDESVSKSDRLFWQKEWEFAENSPCLNTTAYPECEKYCHWHKDLVTNKLTKHELLLLMRYGLSQAGIRIGPVEDEGIKLLEHVFWNSSQ